MIAAVGENTSAIGMLLRALGGLSLRRGRLEIWIAVSAIAVLVATVAVVFYALRGLASEVNRIDQDLTRQSTEAALSAFERRLTDTHRDYAKWDDAVANLYNTPDTGFLRENYSDGTSTGLLFDTALLIDEHGQDLARFENGKPLEVSSGAYFGKALSRLIEGSRADPGTYSVASGFVRTADGIAAVAAGPVVPFSAGVKTPAGQERILVLAKHLGAPGLEQLGKEFVITGLRFADAPPAAGQGVTLNDPTAAPIGAVTWTQRTPGTTAFARISPAVEVTLSLLALVVLGVVALCWVNLRATFRSKEIAEHAAHHDFLTGLPNRTGEGDRRHVIA